MIYWFNKIGVPGISESIAKRWDKDPDGLIFSICESHPAWETIIKEADKRNIRLYVPSWLKTGDS